MALHRNATAVIERHCVGLAGVCGRIHRDRANDAACVRSNLEFQTVNLVVSPVDRASNGLSIAGGKFQRLIGKIGVRQREAAIVINIGRTQEDTRLQILASEVTIALATLGFQKE